MKFATKSPGLLKAHKYEYICVFYESFAKKEEDLGLMSVWAPAGTRAGSAPSGCRSRRASLRSHEPPLDSCSAGKCRGLHQETGKVDQTPERQQTIPDYDDTTIKRHQKKW